MIASPIPGSRTIPGAFSNDDSLLRTPSTASRRTQPDHDEMHPSKIQQSTAKAPDSGLRLGFIDVKENGKPVTIKAIESTPSKSTLDTSTAGFDFKWSKENDLSSEAQKIMESVREEAAKIKEKLQAERDEQARKDEEADQMGNIGQRKIAKPKGKAGRYSDAHREEFKKMDSISNHVSVWKNKISTSNSNTSLKRTNSKANLGDLESTRNRPDSDRLENTAPGKRIKATFHADVSSARPVSRDSQIERSPTKIEHGLPSFVTTPTKASLARSASVKTLRSSKIPSLSRSKSSKDITSPSVPQTEGSNKYLSSLKRVTSVKSILQRPQRKFSDDPLKIAAGTHLPTPKRVPDVNKNLPTLPVADRTTPVHSPSIKRVGFVLNNKAASDLAAASPSPSKIPSLITQRPIEASPTKIPDKLTYPNLQRLNNGPLSSHPPGDFSFRSSKPMNFGPATSGVNSPTIRRVRPSGIATPITAFENLPAVPHGMPNKKRRRVDEDDDDGDEVEDRHENQENHPPADLQSEDMPSPAKKTRRTPVVKQQQQEDMPKTGAADRRRMRKGNKGTVAGGTSKEKKGMSLSRLNMLARPKERH